MKRLLAMALALLGLVACGAPSAAPAETPGPNPMEWGTVASEEPAAEEPRAAEGPAVPEEPSILEEPAILTLAPEPQPDSLREIFPETATVWVDGVPLEGLCRDGAYLLDAEELSEIWPWFQGAGDGETWTFTGEYDELEHRIDCREPERFSGVECVYYAGEREEYWLPVRWLSGCFGRLMLRDQERGEVYLTRWPETREIPEGIPVPVMMYHAVSDDLWGIEELFVSPWDMRAQLEYLLNEGYEPIFFSDLPNLSDYEKPILLTFDDGYDDNYTELLPMLREYGIKATVFIITGMVGDEHYLTEEQIREMADSGLVEIQSHTVTHQDLDTLSREEQEYELARSRLDVARLTGRIPYVLCYPTGYRNEDTLELMPDYYVFGVDMGGGLWYTGESWYKVDRIYISRYDTMEDFTALLP